MYQTNTQRRNSDTKIHTKLTNEVFEIRSSVAYLANSIGQQGVTILMIAKNLGLNQV